MVGLWIFLGILCAIVLIGLSVWKFQRKESTKDARQRATASGKYTAEEIDNALNGQEQLPVPGFVMVMVSVATVVFLSLGVFDKAFFYAEPGYVYHVRTLYPAQERVVDSVGYSYYGFGFYTPWKKAMTVQAAGDTTDAATMDAEADAAKNTSAGLPPLNIVFLDQVDADAFATARFRIPSDEQQFLLMAHEYRTPENLLRTALIPAFKETLNATGSLMSAEEFYAGGRTEFNNEFEVQMQDGIYLVKRNEIRVPDLTAHAKSSANASKGDNQDDYGDGFKTIFKVEKIYAEGSATPLRKVQKFKDYGIVVVEARVTDMKPNDKFVERMKLKQKASADRAIAREQRIQEEEQKLLAVAKGEREVAERQASAKVNQIEQTTNAETTKQLAITAANQLKEQATIEEETAAINLRRDKIKAKSVTVLADAGAYEKKVLLEADNALQIKLDAIVQMNKDTASALATRQVPATVVYQGGDSANGLGTDGDIRTVAQTQMLKNLKALDLNIDVKK